MVKDNGKIKKTAFIVSEFPRYVDAYFFREIKELDDHGLPIHIFSLKTFKGKVIHEDTRRFKARTVYIPFFFSLKLLRAQFFFLKSSPGRYLRELLFILRKTCKNMPLLLKSLAFFPKSVFFARIIQENGFEHIHANWATHPATSAMIISNLTGIPFSFTGHASDIYLHTTLLPEKMKAAKFILTCTYHNRLYLTGLLNGEDLSSKIIVNYHGVDLNRFKRPSHKSNERFHILSIGSLRECKGFPYLILACKTMAEKGLDFKTIIIGEGPQKKELRKLINSCGLKGKVELKRYLSQEDLIPYYQGADVFVLPAISSIHFGIPNVLLEALAVETPVICTWLPSIPELIKDNESGLIVPERSPQALAEAMERLYWNPEFRKNLAQKGYERIIESFDIRNNGKSLAKIFMAIR